MTRSRLDCLETEIWKVRFQQTLQREVPAKDFNFRFGLWKFGRFRLNISASTAL